LPQHFLVAG